MWNSPYKPLTLSPWYHQNYSWLTMSRGGPKQEIRWSNNCSIEQGQTERIIEQFRIIWLLLYSGRFFASQTSTELLLLVEKFDNSPDFDHQWAKLHLKVWGVSNHTKYVFNQTQVCRVEIQSIYSEFMAFSCVKFNRNYSTNNFFVRLFVCSVWNRLFGYNRLIVPSPSSHSIQDVLVIKSDW